jgi:excisionase family DNA binding protein
MDTIKRETFTALEVAHLFGVSAATVYREAQIGSALGAFRVRRRVLFPRNQVLQLLRAFETSQRDQRETEQGAREEATAA